MQEAIDKDNKVVKQLTSIAGELNDIAVNYASRAEGISADRIFAVIEKLRKINSSII